MFARGGLKERTQGFRPRRTLRPGCGASDAACAGGAGRPRAIAAWARAAPARGQGRTGPGGRAAAFTLTELLVAIAVVILVVSMIVSGVSAVTERQRRTYTQQIIRTAVLAIEQFAEENPLRLIYDQRERAGFGRYPPYQLEYGRVWNSNQPAVAHLLDRNDASTFNNPQAPQNGLRYRIARDLLGLSNPGDVSANSDSPASPINLDDLDAQSVARLDDDNRALYTYLAVLSPQALATIPADAIRPLTYHKSYASTLAGERVGEFVNTAPQGQRTEQTRTPVRGIHDAWGVPLDYLLYVRIEWIGDTAEDLGYRIVERRPVLRSRGISRERYDLWLELNAADRFGGPLNSPSDWIWSEPLPRPWADIEEDSDEIHWHANVPSKASGWVRAVAAGHLDSSYKHLPSRDLSPP